METQNDPVRPSMYYEWPFATDARALNVAGMGETDRLHQLRTVAVGGVLLVTKIPATDRSAQAALVAVLVAPSVATYAPDASNAGLIIDNI
jgi:hypothetical protein